MPLPPQDLVEWLTNAGQTHVLAGWEFLSPSEQSTFEQQLRGLNLAELAALHQARLQPAATLPPRERLAPMPVESRAKVPELTYQLGENALRLGQVAVLVVAGGQGTRLGALQPKGFFPVGPVSGASLFQVHAEKVLALTRKYGRPIPLCIMTSPATHVPTVDYFQTNSYFGLPHGEVHFFTQGTMPALDWDSGELLLDKPGRLALSPDGHGGTLTALKATGLLQTLKAQGIRTLFYFQVDNPLVRVADPAFLGRHLETKAEVSSKIIRKVEPTERVGVMALVNGRCHIIEYSDLPQTIAEERTPTGDLAFNAGSPAIHFFDLSFLERITADGSALPFHIAKKKVPYWNATLRESITPMVENAMKCERFIFDALPLAEQTYAMEVTRADEFAPLKNATGPDSPATVSLAISALHRQWLLNAGLMVTPGPVEISPLYAINEADVKAKAKPVAAYMPPLYLKDS